jgi:hypothetical protein
MGKWQKNESTYTMVQRTLKKSMTGRREKDSTGARAWALTDERDVLVL